MIRRLIEALHAAKLDHLRGEEIADLLWLAVQRERGRGASRPGLSDIPGGSDQRRDEPSPRSTIDDLSSQRKGSSFDAGEEPATSTGGNSHNVYLPDSADSEDHGSGGFGGIGFPAPGVAALPNQLAIGRSLRPLSLRIPSPVEMVFDIEATVRRIAEERTWIPLRRPATERWLELALVIDESANMVIWRQTVDELQSLFERQGAFRTISRWGMRADQTLEDKLGKLLPPAFYAGSRYNSGGLPPLRSPQELAHPHNRRLIVLVSDCVALGWRNGQIENLLAQWTGMGMVALVQVLPENLWPRTGLAQGIQVMLRAATPGVSNSDLQRHYRWHSGEEELPDGLLLPVTTLEPERLSLWARSLVGRGQAWTPGILFPDKKFKSSQPIPMTNDVSHPDTISEQPDPTDPKEWVERFFAEASAPARTLAGYLAVVPLSLPVMRLVQDILMHEVQQVHLAEIFLSDLIVRRPGQADDLHPDEVLYDFRPGVREALLTTLLESEIEEVLERTSYFVDSSTGQPIRFSALLEDPTQVEWIHISPDSLPFAQVSAEVLRSLGGVYAELAMQLEILAYQSLGHRFGHFIDEVEKALGFLRKRNHQRLGQLPILRKLDIVQSRLRDDRTSDEIFVGRILADVLMDIIETMRPYENDNDPIDIGRHYVLLERYFMLGDLQLDVQHRLGVERAQFYNIRREAIQEFAYQLWTLNMTLNNAEVNRRERIVCDLPSQMYSQYVVRYDANNRNIVDVIIEHLLINRTWIIMLGGFSGVGKTVVAYEVAKMCCARKYFNAVIWISMTSNNAFQVKRVENDYEVSSLDMLLDKIGKTLQQRQILSIPDLEGKIKIVRRILAEQNCLLVLDGLEQAEAKDIDEIRSFFKQLPTSCKVLITSRIRNTMEESVVVLTPMQKAEAFEFIRIEAEHHGLVHRLKSEEILEIFQKTSGIPLAMQFMIGQRALLGSIPEIEGFSHNERLNDETRQEYQAFLNTLLKDTYFRLLKDESRRILHALSVFSQRVGIEILIATSGLSKEDAMFGLGYLDKSFLVEQDIDGQYELPQTTIDFVRSLQRVEFPLENDESINDYLIQVHKRLTLFCINRLQAHLVEEKLVFLKDRKPVVMAMLEWCYLNNESELFIELLYASGRTFGILGYSSERLLWGQRAVEVCSLLGKDEQAHWFMVHDIAWTKIKMGGAAEIEGRRTIENSLKIAKEKYYSKVEALALRNLGRLLGEENNPEAISYLRQALLLWETIEDDEWIAHTSSALGWVLCKFEHYSEAKTTMERALQLHRKVGHVDGIVGTLSELALVECKLGNMDQARLRSEVALSEGERIAYPAPAHAYALWRRAMLEVELKSNKEMIRERFALPARTMYARLGIGLHWNNEAVKWLDEFIKYSRKKFSIT